MECASKMGEEMKFKIGDTVNHITSGTKYIIKEVPENKKRLESSNSTFYVYFQSGRVSPTIWFRCASEMEDGRFELVDRK